MKPTHLGCTTTNNNNKLETSQNLESNAPQKSEQRKLILHKPQSCAPSALQSTSTIFPTKKRKNVEEKLSSQKRRKTTAERIEDGRMRLRWLDDVKDIYGHCSQDPEFDPQNVHMPSSDRTNLSSYEKQYWEIKCKNWNVLILCKNGTFYHAYEQDAYILERELNLKLLEPNGQLSMYHCGIPENALKRYVARLVHNSHKVGIIEQMETAAQQKERTNGKAKVYLSKDNVRKRELIHIITPGTLNELDYIDDFSVPNYLLSIKQDKRNNQFGICYADVSTGDFVIGRIEDDSNLTAFDTLIRQINAREILYERQLSHEALKRIKQTQGTDFTIRYIIFIKSSI